MPPSPIPNVENTGKHACVVANRMQKILDTVFPAWQSHAENTGCTSRGSRTASRIFGYREPGTAQFIRKILDAEVRAGEPHAENRRWRVRRIA